MAEERPAAPAGGGSQMLIIMMLFLTMFIMFDPTLRLAVGNAAGFVLRPIIGFDNEYPVVTVMFAGFLMVTLSTVIRHYFIDWVSVAEKQKKMKDFNKTLRKARMEGDQAEVQRLMKKQLQMTRDTMASTMDQMKPMMFTMIFLIATFAFIGAFMMSIPGATLSVPWANNVDLNGSMLCYFQNWILVYFLISISMAQIVQRLLKWYSFSKKIKVMDEEPDEAIEEFDDEDIEEFEELEEDLDPEEDEKTSGEVEKLEVGEEE